MDFSQGGNTQEQEEQGGNTFMDDLHEAEDLIAEKEAEATADDASRAAQDKTNEAEATADDASLTTKTIEAETPVKDASDAAKDKTPEAEATAKDASQSAKAPSSSGMIAISSICIVTRHAFSCPSLLCVPHIL